MTQILNTFWKHLLCRFYFCHFWSSGGNFWKKLKKINERTFKNSKNYFCTAWILFSEGKIHCESCRWPILLLGLPSICGGGTQLKLMYSPMYPNVHQCSPMWINSNWYIQKCSPICTNVTRLKLVYSPMCTNVHQCDSTQIDIFTNVYQCSPMWLNSNRYIHQYAPTRQTHSFVKFTVERSNNSHWRMI